MFGSGYENCPKFGVLGGVIFKLDISDYLSGKTDNIPGFYCGS
jgi:hypothetical protein